MEYEINKNKYEIQNPISPIRYTRNGHIKLEMILKQQSENWIQQLLVWKESVSDNNHLEWRLLQPCTVHYKLHYNGSCIETASMFECDTLGLSSFSENIQNPFISLLLRKFPHAFLSAAYIFCVPLSMRVFCSSLEEIFAETTKQLANASVQFKEVRQ